MKFCPHCVMALDDRISFCPNCNGTLERPEQYQTDSSSVLETERNDASDRLENYGSNEHQVLSPNPLPRERVLLYTEGDPYLFLSFLQGHGIPCWLENEHNPKTRAQVAVPAAHLEQANALLKDVGPQINADTATTQTHRKINGLTLVLWLLIPSVFMLTHC
jgi:hypothetical protein